jgi:hypothetical protein
MFGTAWVWITENLFSSLIFWVVAAMLAYAAIADAYNAWEHDLPWFGWDLRKLRRWRFDQSENS